MGQIKRPLAIDAFSGAGGLSLGLYKAGFQIGLAYDNDDVARRSYNCYFKDKFGEVCVKADATDMDILKLLKRFKIKKQDIILYAGGPPCQGFSVQRRGNDLDPRNDLVRYFIDQALEIKPPFIMLENVVGISNKRGNEIIQYISNKCEQNDYHVHMMPINAASYGVPQIRKRFFIVAERTEADGLTFFNFPKPIYSPDKFKTVRQALVGLPTPPPDGTEHLDIPNHRCDVLSPKNKKRFHNVRPGHGRDDIPEDLRLQCHKVSTEKAGHRYVYGRLRWNKPSGVITARFDSLTRGRFGHPSQDRTISLREGARLQSFPDNFVFVGTKVQVARQIGNAVPPKVSRALGKAILKAWRIRINANL